MFVPFHYLYFASSKARCSNISGPGKEWPRQGVASSQLGIYTMAFISSQSTSPPNTTPASVKTVDAHTTLHPFIDDRVADDATPVALALALEISLALSVVLGPLDADLVIEDEDPRFVVPLVAAAPEEDDARLVPLLLAPLVVVPLLAPLVVDVAAEEGSVVVLEAPLLAPLAPEEREVLDAPLVLASPATVVLAPLVVDPVGPVVVVALTSSDERVASAYEAID